MVCLIRTFSHSIISRFVSFSPDILRQLLEHELVVDLVDHVEGENGRAPLHFAAKFNHTEIAKELLQHGASKTRQRRCHWKVTHIHGSLCWTCKYAESVFRPW